MSNCTIVVHTIAAPPPQSIAPGLSPKKTRAKCETFRSVTLKVLANRTVIYLTETRLHGLSPVSPLRIDDPWNGGKPRWTTVLSN
jgi:hypothetical protein